MALRALPFNRIIQWQLDACPGTNRSQQAKGSFAFLLLTGVLDAVEFCYMVVGHTKFGPDEAALKTGGAFNRNDTFNLAHLKQNFEPYASVRSYDEETLLRTWKEAQPEVFSAIDQIMKYRRMMLVGDDGANAPCHCALYLISLYSRARALSPQARWHLALLNQKTAPTRATTRAPGRATPTRSLSVS